MTEFVFKYIRKNRELFLNLVNSVSIEQLNKIPEGFNNNIVWNFGHIVVTTQALAYIRSGVKPDMQIAYLDKYRSGTNPGDFIVKQEIDELKKTLFASIDKIEADMQTGDFINFKPFASGTYKYEMNTIEEAITCSLTHDSLHYGYALAQKKLV